MLSLKDREKYCFGLIIVNAGEASLQEIRNIVVETKGPFEGLDLKYLKRKAVKNVLRSLVKKNCLSEKDSKFKINPIFELGFIRQYPSEISKAIKSELNYRKKHILHFDTIEVEEILLNEESYDTPPFDLISELNEAMELHRNGKYDSVLVKCGRCVELMLNELDEDYCLSLGKLKSGNKIGKLKSEEVCEELSVERDDLNTFVEGIGLIYKFRNKMGAHASGVFDWGKDQVATSCLILTIYLADFYASNIRKG